MLPSTPFYKLIPISRRLRLAGMFALLLTALLTITASANLANRKISGTIPAFGDAEHSLISPDEKYAVYSADQDADEVYELYSVRLSGGTPVKLNAPLPTDTYFEQYSALHYFLIQPTSLIIT